MIYKKSHTSLKPFLDLLLCLVLCCVAIILVVQTKRDNEKRQPENTLYKVILNWSGTNKADIDLWMQDSQGRTISFNRREGGEGSVASLDRDSLGHNDFKDGKALLKKHEEIIKIRAKLQGEHIVNVHAYNLRDEVVEVEVKLVQVKPYKEIVAKKKTFESTGDEYTLFRWTFDKKGEIVDINEMQAIVAQNQDENSYNSN